jgi:hypothetical protein
MEMKKIFVFAVILCALVIANISLADGLTDGLVGFYPFDGNAFDMSGNMNNGIKSDNVSFVNGIFGQAAKFGGFDLPGSIRVPNSPSLQFGSEFSINLWAKVDQMGSMNGVGGFDPTLGGGCIFAKDHDQYGFHSKVFALPNSDFTAYFSNNYSSTPKIGIAGTINQYSPGDWVNIGFTVKGTEAKCYMNGSPINTTTNSAVNFSVANSRDLYFGKFNDSWYPFNGAIDEVRIYNRALNQTEMQQLSVAPTPEPIPPTPVVAPPKTYGLFIGAREDKWACDLIAERMDKAFKDLATSGNRNVGSSLAVLGDGLNVSIENINNKIDDIVNKLKDNDNLVIFMSGHGSKNNNNEYSIQLGRDNLSSGDLYTLLNRNDLKSVNKWVIIDSCLSGAAWDSIKNVPKTSLIAGADKDHVIYWGGYDIFQDTEIVKSLWPNIDLPLIAGWFGYGFLSLRLINGFTDEINIMDSDCNGIQFNELVNYLKENETLKKYDGIFVREGEFGDLVPFASDNWNPLGLKTDDFSGNIFSPVPLPPTVLLLGSGLLGLVGYRRFRKG